MEPSTDSQRPASEGYFQPRSFEFFDNDEEDEFVICVYPNGLGRIVHRDHSFSEGPFDRVYDRFAYIHVKPEWEKNSLRTRASNYENFYYEATSNPLTRGTPLLSRDTENIPPQRKTINVTNTSTGCCIIS